MWQNWYEVLETFTSSLKQLEAETLDNRVPKIFTSEFEKTHCTL